MTNAAKAIFGKRKLNSRIDYVIMSREGISMKALNKIQDYTSLTNKELSNILPISERQLARYKEDQILKKSIASHLIQLVELFENVYDLFGEEKFRKWIRTKIIAIGNNTPIELMDTPIGMQIVEDLIVRIEHGVYS